MHSLLIGMDFRRLMFELIFLALLPLSRSIPPEHSLYVRIVPYNSHYIETSLFAPHPKEVDEMSYTEFNLKVN